MLCFNLFWFSMLWVSLTTRQLVSFYTYLLAFATVPLSYLLNSFTVSYILASDPMVQLPFSLLSKYFYQFFIGDFFWKRNKNIPSKIQNPFTLKPWPSCNFPYTVSAWMQPHSWIEPHPIQNLIQPQSKNSFETI